MCLDLFASSLLPFNKAAVNARHNEARACLLMAFRLQCPRYLDRASTVPPPPPARARGYLRTMRNRVGEIPGAGKTLFVAAARSAPRDTC